ncbi:hypothetical protein BJ508DRAFT_419364 [Ascobolus immersus RN42]|uniref:Uncharacterized protein n=1 Tax=Ascobolus immersus RN42 TaxID=1160509 RepID=A0A3N4HER6_ASCIM|nr:hypothetical protein BJ508DRAFT_419364 [Ascobolus immersus RN42]
MEGVRYREVVSLAEAARNGGLPTDSIGSPEALEVSFQCEGFDPKIMLDDAISVEMNTWANLSLTTSDLRSISEFPTQALHTWRDERAQTQLRPTESASSLQPAPQTVPTIPTEEMSLDSQAEDINRRREERVQAWLDQLILKFESEI